MEEFQLLGNAPKVLLVDDEPFNIIAMSHLFKQEGIVTESAYNGEKAIELI